MSCPSQCGDVNLGTTICISKQTRQKCNRTSTVFLTVFSEKTPTTLSHSVPAFGFQPSSLDNARASQSTRSFTSYVEYLFPVIPQMKGSREVLNGWRPYFSPSMKSQIGTESGGSMGSFGTHCGGVK